MLQIEILTCQTGSSFSADFNQSISSLPVAFQVRHHSAAFGFGNLRIFALDNPLSFAAGAFQKLAVANEVRNPKVGRSCLFGAEELAMSALFEVKLCDRESVLSARHSIESLLSLRSDFPAGHEHAVGFVRTASDAPAQLMKLGRTEALSMFDHHYCGVRDIDPHFDHCRGD